MQFGVHQAASVIRKEKPMTKKNSTRARKRPTPHPDSEPAHGPKVVNLDADPLCEFPGINERPCFGVYFEEQTLEARKYLPGLYWHTVKRTDDGVQLPNDRIGDPLEILARTSSKEHVDNGRLLRWTNPHGEPRQMAIPMDLFSGDEHQITRCLRRAGYEWKRYWTAKLLDYIHDSKPEHLMGCATRTGWYTPTQFVLPYRVIGNPQDVWFQSDKEVNMYAKAGTFDAWQQLAALPARNNPVLMFGIAFGLCGPLMDSLGLTFLGAHLYGDSTTGKTTILWAAASCWGHGKNFTQSWRATANGMESTAVEHTDTLVALDEIKEVKPADLDEVIYMLANGKGKKRADKTGGGRPISQHRVPVLSSGEQSIAAKLAEGGLDIMAGQEIRILDIPAMGKYGAFDTLPEKVTASQFADSIMRATCEHYGWAGEGFVEALLTFRAIQIEVKFNLAFKEVIGNRKLDGQSERGARVFGAAALAGEIAQQAGIVPWESGEATKAARACLELWLKARKTSEKGSEHFKILTAVKAFIDSHGDSRFEQLEGRPPAAPIVHRRAGYWVDEVGEPRLYLFTTDGLHEATKGYDFDRVLRALLNAGAFAKQGTNERAASASTADGKKRLYWINPEKLEPSTP
jgi:putative DNA primase/helicase